MSEPPGIEPRGIERRMRDALRVALRGRDAAATAALRSALAAVANSEAIDLTESPVTSGTASEHVAGSHVGLGAAERPRVVLSEDDVRGLVRLEIVERGEAAVLYARHGDTVRAERLEAEAAVLTAILAADAEDPAGPVG